MVRSTDPDEVPEGPARAAEAALVLAPIEGRAADGADVDAELEGRLSASNLSRTEVVPLADSDEAGRGRAELDPAEMEEAAAPRPLLEAERDGPATGAAGAAGRATRGAAAGLYGR